MSRILILGATGHLGAYTALHLNSVRHQVIAVGHRDNDNGFFKSNDIEYIGGFDLKCSKSFDVLPSDIDAVVHLAGAMPAHADGSPMPYIQSIIVGMVNLCEWLKDKSSCRRVIFNTTPSDVCAYFGTTQPVSADAPRSFPKDGGDHAIYAIAKNAAVDILEHYKYAHNISSCIFRHMTIYGYKPNPFYFVNGIKQVLPWRRIVDSAQKGEPIEVWGDSNRKKELLYIKDFTRAVESALNTDAEGIYNLAGVKPYTLLEQIDGIIAAFSPTGNQSQKIFCPEKPDSPQILLDATKTKDVLRWTPQFNWTDACIDMKQEMINEPLALLWGKSSDYTLE